MDLRVSEIKKFNKSLSVTADGKTSYYDYVIMTVPTPYVVNLVPELTLQEKEKFMSIDNIGVVCVVLELAKSVSDKFWVNICDEQFDIPGIIEFSNLRTVKNNIVYVPYYMPITNPKYFDTDEVFLRKCMHYIKIINPDIKEEDLINHHIGRLKFSQPICTPGFKSRLPSICSSINHLQIADTSYYYPEDRGFSESIKLGRLMANNLVQKKQITR